MISECIEKTDDYDICRTKRAVPHQMPSTHYHDHYEIYYLVKGEIRYFIGNMTFDLKAGDMVLIPPGVIHKTASAADNSMERILLIFTDNFLLKDPGDKIFDCFGRYYIENAGALEKLLIAIESEHYSKDKYSFDIIRCYIETLLIRLSRIVSDTVAEKPVQSEFQKIANYITENYASEITLEKLSQMYSISKSHLSRQFKLTTGFGLNEYITLVRIKNAERLILNTSYPITDIATMCGFNDSSYFSVVFKKIKGISPLKLRLSNF